MVAMETSSHMDSDMSYQIFARQILEKVAKFGNVCFNIKKVINVQSRRGQNPPICSSGTRGSRRSWYQIITSCTTASERPTGSKASLLPPFADTILGKCSNRRFSYLVKSGLFIKWTFLVKDVFCGRKRNENVFDCNDKKSC